MLGRFGKGAFSKAHLPSATLRQPFARKHTPFAFTI